MPRLSTSPISARIGDTLADLVQDILDALLPTPEPEPIPVRAKERR